MIMGPLSLYWHSVKGNLEMKISKSRFKQIIQEEMASLAEIEEEDEDDEYEEEYYGSRTWEQDQEDREKRYEAEERHASEAEYASIVVAFRNILDGILGDDFPEYDFYDELKNIADYAIEHRHRWEAAAPEREEHASELGDRIAASQAERGRRLPSVTRAGVERLQKGVRSGHWPKKWSK